jgi:hypothetical protein
MIDPDEAFTIGAGTLITCVVVSGILWYTLYRLVRWVLW